MVLLAAAASMVAGQSLMSDGQIVAVSSASIPAVKQITDGQIQVPTATPTPVKQITDGQIQVPKASASASPSPSANGTLATASPKPFIGAAGLTTYSAAFLTVAGGVAGLLLL